MSIGFGLERLGLVALKYPRATGLVVMAFTLLCLAVLPQAKVDGDLMRIYRGSGDKYDHYQELSNTFGTFDNDTYLLVTTDRLTDPEVLETLRVLALDLELEDYAAGTLSPFSLRKPGPNDVTVPAVPENMTSAEQVRDELNKLRATDPIMQNLIIGDLTGMVFITFADQSKLGDGGEAEMIASLKRLAADYTTDDIKVEVTGASIWKLEMLEASVSDQITFSAYGFIIGFFTALLSFRTFWGAFLATLIPGISVIWVSGAVTMLFGSFTFLTVVVTTLVMVIAFAEAMFFCFTWLRLWREGMDPVVAIRETVIRVSAACALTSLTTLIAFASLGLTQGQGIGEFAVAGALSVVVAYVALVTFLPLALRIALKLGFKNPAAPSVALTAPIPPISYITGRWSKPLAVGAIILAAMLFVPHFRLEPRFSFQDFLPKQADSLQVAGDIDEGVGGVSPIYLRVKLDEAVSEVTDPGFQKIIAAHNIFEEQIGQGKVISAASLMHYSDSGFTLDQIFRAVGPFLTHRFITDDHRTALITGFLPTMASSNDVMAFVGRTNAALADAGLDGVDIAGFRVLTSFGSIDMIRSLQNGLTIAVFVAIGVIALAFRSIKIGLVSFIPNILPILGTEAYLYFSGAGLQVTTAIALTIAFGIAVDDTIHFLAHYKRMREAGHEHREAVSEALVRVGPALIATTVILVAGLFIVMFSALPQVALFGTLTLITLVLALVGDLFMLPAILLAGGRFFDSLGGLKK